MVKSSNKYDEECAKKMKKKNEEILIADIVLVDIIDFSLLDIHEQLEVINYLTRSYSKMIEQMLISSGLELKDFILGFIPTGDGFYCILNPKIIGYGALLALSFSHLSEYIAKKFSYFKGLKIAVHTGQIYEFRDILGHKNYIGDGLNDCARYLETKNYTVSTVMISDVAYEYLKKFLNTYKDFDLLLMQREFKHSSEHIFKDKHGNSKMGYLIWLRKTGIINLPIIK